MGRRVNAWCACLVAVLAGAGAWAQAPAEAGGVDQDGLRLVTAPGDATRGPGPGGDCSTQVVAAGRGQLRRDLGEPGEKPLRPGVGQEAGRDEGFGRSPRPGQAPVADEAANRAAGTAASPGDDRSGAAGGDEPPPPVAAEPRVQFNFKGATFDQVIDFFSRVTGLPVVKKTDVPQGTLDYLAPESYTVSEALEILNIILQARGVMLLASDRMLFLQKLDESIPREAVPVFVNELAGDVRPNDIVTVVRPLNAAQAEPLAEKLKVLVAPYGAMTALAQQNAIVITETAAQVRRLLTIVEEVDREDPEDAIDIFAVRHAKAKDLMEPLKALLSKRVERYVPDPKGQMVKVEEQVMPGLNVSFDERTNTIIAKGVQTRINKVRETIAMLDVPAAAAARVVRTFVLSRMAPSDAAARLEQLYAKLPEAERPTVLPLDDLGRITVVGAQGPVAEAQTLLSEIDGGAVRSDEPAQAIAVVSLQYGDPASIAAAARTLLNGRQASSVRMVPGTDRRSLLVAGLAEDVAAAQGAVALLDRPPAQDRRIRVLRLASPDPAGAVRRAEELYQKQRDPADTDGEIDIDLDEAAGVLTLVGPDALLDRFSESLRLVEANTVIERETRRIELEHAKPGELLRPLSELSARLLRPSDGGAYVAPSFEALDPLQTLLVTALPEQYLVIEPLVETLDRPGPDDLTLRVVSLAGSDARKLLEKARLVYQRLAAGADPPDLPPPELELDAATGNLVLSGRTEAVALYERAVAEARKLLPPARSGRLLDLAHARAADVASALRELLARTVVTDPARTVPEPQITVVERTNSLYVVAEPAQHEMVERHLKRLDAREPAELAPLQILSVRAVDAMRLAQMLRDRYDSRPVEERLARPVDITADAETNALIVTAPPDLFEEMRNVVETVNKAGREESDRQIMLFPLKRARAADVASALDRLYPEPPMPVDRRGQPLPHLRLPKEVHVQADQATNTIIVEAPADRRAQFEALVEQLDRVQLPPQAELRTYHIERGDVAQIARTLAELARRGVMSALPQEGTKPVEVIVQAEPVSRTLIVAGDEVTFAKTQEMLADLQAVPVPRTLRVFDVDRADPREIAERARKIYAEQTAQIPDAGAVSVEVDLENGVLLVVADDEAMVRMARILDELEASIGPPPEIRLLSLEHADAAEVVEFLRDLVQSARIGGWEGPAPTFEAIERTNSLLVAGRTEMHEIVRALVEAIDRPGADSVPPLRILQLRTADAPNLAGALQAQYNQRHPDARKARPVSITADPNTNSLVVAAHPEILPEIQAIVDELNEADLYGAGGREIRIFPLRVARAEDLARTIDEMYPPPPVPRDRRGQPLYHLQAPREVIVRADPQTNSLIVDAPLQRMAGFEKLVEQLDRQDVAVETEVRTYRIVHAGLDAVAGTLRQLAAAGGLSPSRADRRVPTTITTEPAGRVLVVAGPGDVFERVEQVLAELDAPRAAPETSLRFLRLEHARAETVVPMLREVLLRRLAEDVPDAGADAADLVHISSDRKTNTLVISARAGARPSARGRRRARRADLPPGPGGRARRGRGGPLCARRPGPRRGDRARGGRHARALEQLDRRDRGPRPDGARRGAHRVARRGAPRRRRPGAHDLPQARPGRERGAPGAGAAGGGAARGSQEPALLGARGPVSGAAPAGGAQAHRARRRRHPAQRGRRLRPREPSQRRRAARGAAGHRPRRCRRRRPEIRPRAAGRQCRRRGPRGEPPGNLPGRCRGGGSADDPGGRRLQQPPGRRERPAI
jgi:type II secretory pathway component GspD/PulD (secretin)